MLDCLLTSLALLGSGVGPPNVLVLVLDDIGNDMVGSYGEGDPAERPRTPVLDRIARRSVRFVNAYSHPSCSPTRASMLTGRYAFRHGIGSRIRNRDSFALPLSEWTIPEVLDAAGSGYSHLALGKWHLGTDAASGAFHPCLQGFRVFVGTPSNISSYDSWPKVLAEQDGLLREWTSHEYLTIDQTSEAIRRIPELREPWFVWMSYSAAHSPFHAPPSPLHSRPDPQGPFEKYRAMVESVDSEVGRLMRGIQDVLPRTMLFVVGDNGSPAQAAFVSPSKGSLADGGVNVPLLVTGPAVPRSQRGSVSDSLVLLQDVFATVMDLAGVDSAAVLPPDHAIDSRSLLPILRDPSARIRDHAFSERFEPNGHGPYTTRMWMIRDENFKLILNAFPGPSEPVMQFFDLRQAPPGEDGVDLCPCPGGLSPEARQAWIRLQAALDEIRAS